MAVTVFRCAYEQLGNTVALWADVGIDRHIGSVVIPMTWFQSLNPLFVILMTPPLLAWWRRRDQQAREPSDVRKMTTGAVILASAYLLIAIAAEAAGQGRANALWLVLFFAVVTFGELHILPVGLGLFARLAPARYTATTVAAWFFVIFTGSLSAGAVGTLWSRTSHAEFFTLLAALAAVAAGLLRALEPLESMRGQLKRTEHVQHPRPTTELE